MDRLFVLLPFLKKLAQGSVIRAIAGWIIRIMSFIVLCAALYVSVRMWAEGFSMSFFFPILVVQILLLAMAYVLMNVCWLHSREILALEEDGQYPMTQLFVSLARMSGELLAVGSVFMGLALCFTIWFGGDQLVYVLAEVMPTAGSFLGGEGFVGGVLSMVIGIVYALVCLVCSYVFAEILVGFVTIAKNSGGKA